MKNNIRKSIALFIMATLLLPMLTFAVPVSASTGHPAIGGMDDGGLLTWAITSVNVTAGQIDVVAIDNEAGSYGNLTIIFYNSSLTNPLLVDFSGAQFDLYMSPNGYSNLTSDDVLYASGFTVSSEGDPIYELVNGSFGTIDSISNDVATINTNVGTLLTTVDALNATIIAIDGDVAAIQTALGTMQASLDAIGLKVTALNGTAATMQTSLGTLTGTVTSMNGDIATIKTDLGTVKTNVAAVKGFLPVDMTPVWIAVVLSLIAAIAAIYSIVVIRSKIAA